MIRKKNLGVHALWGMRCRREAFGITLSVLALLPESFPLLVQAQKENFAGELQSLKSDADAGNALAQYELANRYEKMNSDLKAAQYWQKSAEQGYAPAQAAFGSALGRGVGVGMDISNAITWYRKAAEQDYPVAEYAMGNFYAEGKGVALDLDQAVQWWKKAAARNYANAEAALGEFYAFPQNEHGTNYVNCAEGIRWLRRAAAHGSAAAMNNLGLAYQTGTGVKIDAEKSVRWYREGAERGDDMAQASLGECYFFSYGVPRDPIEAYKWIKLSALQGCFLGNKDISLFSDAPLKPKDLAEAEQRVLDFHVRTDTNYPVQVELVPVTNPPAAKIP